MSAPPVALTPARRAGWSVLLVLIFGLQLALVVRTHVMRDDRYGFAMFHEIISYEVEHRWRMGSDVRVRWRPDAGVFKSRGRPIGGQGRGTSVMGLGSVRLQIGSFMRWAWENKRPKRAIALETRLRYQVNGRGEWVRERFVWPPEPEAP